MGKPMRCPKHGAARFSPPDDNGRCICMACYKAADSSLSCDCLWDQVPLRGPHPNCPACGGTGVLLKPDGTSRVTVVMRKKKAG